MKIEILLELSGIQLNEEVIKMGNVVIARDKNVLEGLLKFKLDGTTPIYIVRDSDINGALISMEPIKPEQIEQAIKDHSNWK